VNYTCALTNVNFGINGTTELQSKGETEQSNSGTKPSGATNEQAFLIEKATEVTRTLDKSLTQEGIFNRLTNNGEVQGLILYNGKVYLNAEYIQAGTIAANLLMAAILTIGGANNGNGQIKILDANGNVIGTWDKNGISVTKGSITGGTINGATLTLGGNNNASGTLTVKDASGNIIGTWNNAGMTLNKGSIAGPSITIGGQNNTNGVLNVNDNNNNTLGTIDTDGITLYGIQYDINLNERYLNFYNKSHTHSVNVYAAGYNDNIDLILYGGPSLILTADGNTISKQWSIGSGQLYSYDSDLKLQSGNLYVGGTKSRLVSTDQYSDRLLYCYETPSPMFGDVGEGTIGEDGKCYVWLDPVFAQTITTTQYQVFLQRYGSGECWVAERKGSYFVVEGTPNMAFGWEIKAKQRDFDQRRLDRNDEPFTVPTQTYGEDAAKHIEDIRKERESA
jgi:hypothetical protein